MTVPAALRVALYLLVADGVAALYLADFVGPRGVALVAAGLAASWWAEALARWSGARLPVDRVVVPVVAAASLVDVLFVAATVLDGLVRLLLFLVLYKLFTLASLRDTRVVSFLAFFMLVAASTSAFGIGFFFVFVSFVIVATWVTLLQHVLLESEPRYDRTVVGGDDWVGHRRVLLGLALGAAGGVILLTAGLFFVLPRVGLAALPLRARFGQLVSGFSDRVELGAYGSIALSDVVAMRVHIPEGIDPTELGLRWRGVVLDQFDGRTWSVRYPRRTRLVHPVGGHVTLGLLRGDGPVLRQEIYLEPIGTEVIFAASRVLHLNLRGQISLDDMGALSAPPSGGRLFYVVDSQLEGRVEADASPWPGQDAFERFTQLPALGERIPALARQVAAGSRSARETATRLRDFLSREYAYTLDLRRVSDEAPLDEFLFVRRAGHCEYFAAALAVMLRSLGIPARVVNGFQRGEWNPYGRYFLVRLRDAHSWVEAYVGGPAWLTLDPTPRAAADAAAWAPPGATFLYLDSLRLTWHRYVINWSIRDQMGAVQVIRRQTSIWGPWLTELRRREETPRLLIGGLIGVGVLVALGFWWRDRPRAGGRAERRRPPRFYARALRAAARRGLRPGPGETAREFARRVAAREPTWAADFGYLTLRYEDARFGPRPLGSDEMVTLEARAAALGQLVRYTSAAR
jgi:hypothetical protein